MVDSRENSDPAEIQLNLEKCLTTLFCIWLNTLIWVCHPNWNL